MARRSDKGRLPPFVPILKDTLDSEAWKATSFGARWLYVALKRRVPPHRNVAYLSCRNAAEDVGANFRRIGDWFRELEHYGFIVLERHGCLGVEGQGKAPQWRLTELGDLGTGQQPTRDFLRWDGVLFEHQRDTRHRLSKTKPCSRRGEQGVRGGVNSSVRGGGTLEAEGVRGGVNIGSGEPVRGGVNITRLTTGVVRAGSLSAPGTAPKGNGRG